jgi:hypothetical protein
MLSPIHAYISKAVCYFQIFLLNYAKLKSNIRNVLKNAYCTTIFDDVMHKSHKHLQFNLKHFLYGSYLMKYKQKNIFLRIVFSKIDY